MNHFRTIAEAISAVKNGMRVCWKTGAYQLKQDKNGNPLNEPVDFQNHGIDALRYVALNKLKVANSGKYFILQA